MAERCPLRRPDVVRPVLVERFPLAFMPAGMPKKPLKIGIREDLEASMPDFQRFELRLALADYCGGPTYLRSLVAGATRIDLAGLPAGTVDAAEAEFAATKLRQMLAKYAEQERRRQARRAERRAREAAE